MAYTYKQRFNKKYGFKLNEPHSIKEIAEITGYKLKGLKTIFERGEGAFYNNPTSVRKNVSSAQQWSFARLYSAVDPKSKAHQIDKMFLIKK
tara:strand:- start:476 stop:751 length:276 start_codon:yes stop_codon:yes gene_type:complete